MRVPVTAMLLGVTLLAPAALAQTAGPSISPSALDGEIKARAPRTTSARRVVKKRPARTAVRKAAAHKTVTKAKAPARRAPAKHVVVGTPILV